MTIYFSLFALLYLAYIAYISRKLSKERRRADNLQTELDELTTRLYGSPEIYERAKDNVRECRTDREQKVAYEAVQKGIPRSAKQYPSRFKGMR